MNLKKFTLAVALLGGSFVGFSKDVANEMLAAYGNLSYSKARRLAQKIPDNPKAKLVLALCQLFDPLKQDLDGGLDSLKKLYDDKTLPVDVWCQAALSYGRVAQLAQERKELYKDLGADANPSDVFMEVISKAPTSKAACTAMLFDLSDDFEGDDPKKIDEALARLEKFCKDFKGKPEYLVSLHLLADQKYIYSKNDFSSAVSHLETAYASGVANPRDAEIVLYRIGRIYDLKLKDKKNAQKFYKTFLKKHPESGYAPAVKRFLGEINGNKKGGVENGKK